MRKWIVVAVLIMGSGGVACGQELDPLSKWAAISFNELHLSQNIVYQRANNSSLKLDVISAGPSQARPTLIYFHGGGWLEGSKDSVLLYALPYLARGMNAVNVEYRMAPESLAPAAVEDCRCALHWVYDHAKQYGFDTSKLVVAGHSAGGHLALITGMLDAGAGFDNECTRPSEEWRQGFIRDVKVAAIVNFFGPTDLVDLLQGPNLRNFAVRWFGGLPNRMEIAKQVSPLTYVRKDLPPIISIVGDKDPIVPYQQAVRLHQGLDREGVPNQLVTIRGGGHGSTTPFAWTREQNLEAQGEITKFLEKYGIFTAANPAP
jgi:acetyl esterase/lipase